MAYDIDLSNIKIDHFKKILRSEDLIPSWKILLDGLNKKMQRIEQLKILNLEDLRANIKDKKHISAFATKSGISIDYLTVLRRALNGYVRKPNRIKDFPGISPGTVEKLEHLGIKHTKALFDEIKSESQRKALAARTGLSKAEILKLAKLTDLSRIQWVNHTFAHVLLEAGYHSAASIANAAPEDLLKKANKIGLEQNLFPAHIGIRDMNRLIAAAKRVSSDIEW